MIELEREIYGRRARERSPLFVRPRRGAENLQDALDSERAGLFAVQFLFGLVIVALALTELIG